MDFEWTTEHVDGVTLVGVRLANETPTDRRIRLANRLDGPVLPPRRHGVPETGWEGEHYETVVPAGDRVAVGYACPAAVADPPVELVADERAPDAAPTPDGDSSAAAVVRRFGRAEPPRDAVPTPERIDARPADGMPDGDTSDGSDSPGVADIRRCDAVDAADVADPADVADSTDVADGTDASDTELPDAVSAWLDAVATRIERAETLTEPSVPEATATLAEMGGLDAVADLPETVADDAEQLRAVASRAEVLAERAESTEVDLAPLRRLA
ncbi:hypothetical protein SAMN04487949_0344 [Halogranum gelatinilyticum]|uniref:DUF8080 domain-containing protein n=1 Tax=Halogranum gelatinilyticum TaxID=660521 RepID=A0A1G9PDB7_9EURY|nr:hypothetical protein [Halogranum gelatinilyticum]SDL96852.1 hypothetical protein SAMN04487949_0344 [Halogranum gelatinilyticum]